MCLPLSCLLGGGTGALCRVYTPGGVLVANLLGSFTLYADNGVERLRAP